MRTQIIAAALGLLVAGGVVADASAATVVTRTRTVAATHAVRPVLATKTVRIVHRPHLAVTRILPGHRLAPRVRMARALPAHHIVKTTVVR